MAIRYKSDILARLKDKGYNTSRLRNEKVFGEKVIQQFRTGAEIPNKTLDRLCELLGCQIGDVIEYVNEKKVSDES